MESVVTTDRRAQQNRRKRMASSRNRCHEKARRSEDWLLRRDGPELDTQQSPRGWFISSTPRVHNSLYGLLLSGASSL